MRSWEGVRDAHGSQIWKSAVLQVAIDLEATRACEPSLKCSQQAKGSGTARRGQFRRTEPARSYVTGLLHPPSNPTPSGTSWFWGGTLVAGRKEERPDLPNSSGLKDAGAVSTKSLSGGRRKAENKTKKNLSLCNHSGPINQEFWRAQLP